MSDDRVQRLCDEIVAARDYVLSIVSNLTPEQFDRPTVNEGWTVKDTLAHLSTIPMRNREMWRHAIEGRAWTGEASVDDYSRRVLDERRAWSGQQVIDEYKREMDEAVAYLKRMRPEDLDRVLDRPSGGPASVIEMASGGPRHHRKHGDEIRAATASEPPA